MHITVQTILCQFHYLFQITEIYYNDSYFANNRAKTNAVIKHQANLRAANPNNARSNIKNELTLTIILQKD